MVMGTFFCVIACGGVLPSVSGTILLQSAWIQGPRNLGPYTCEIVCVHAGTLVLIARDVILLGRILLGFIWIRKCSQILMLKLWITWMGLRSLPGSV